MTGPWIASFALLWAVVVLMAVLQVGMLRRIAPMVLRAESRLRANTQAPLEGLPPGSLAPAFEARDRRGSLVQSSELPKEAKVLILLESHCEPCRKLVAEIANRSEPFAVPLVLVTNGADEVPIPESRPDVTVVYQEDDLVSRAFHSSITPHSFAIDADGVVIASSVPGSADDLSLLGDALSGVRPVNVLDNGIRHANKALAKGGESRWRP